MRLPSYCIFLLIFICFPAFGQHDSQPQKESSDDLRTGSASFVIEELGDNKIIWLERTANLDYFLRSKKGKDEKIIKLSSPAAKKMDMDFASRFLKCQYELPATPKSCKVTLRLKLKGDLQEICEKEEEKTQEIIPMIKKIETLF